MEESKKVSRSDLLKAFWRWMFFSHSCYNYERMQATAVAQFMAPIINKLYPNKEDRIAGYKRHLMFFNTEPNVGAVIHGATIAMEEERANGAPISDEEINSFKSGLMGPLAGIGDTITQGIVTPILLGVCIGIVQAGNVFGTLLYVMLESAAILGIAYTGWMQGYYRGKKFISQMLQSGILVKLLEYAGILGCGVLGALSAQFVLVSTPITMTMGTSALKLQDLIDKIMPSLLPLALTVSVFYFVRKGTKATTLLLWLIIVGAVGALLHVF